VPTMLRALLERDAGSALARPRAVLVGGAACPMPLLEQCAARRVRAVTTYGLTEACSQVTTQRLREGEHLAAEPGSGAPLEGVALSVVDDAGRALPPDTVGRIRVRGPTLMQGYFRHEPLAPGAWFETGDLGALDGEGRLFVHARRTDLVVSGGENVYPAEVEQALEACPGVGQALVFGVADERWGQRVAAVLVPSDPARGLDEGAVYEALAARLAGYKRPKSVCVVDALPLLGNGKVDRAGAVARFSARLRPWGPSA
jgi:O-succinylbenzoic acid--CoA ligase